MPLPSDEVTPPVTKIYFADLVPVAAMMKTGLVVTGYKSTEKGRKGRTKRGKRLGLFGTDSASGLSVGQLARLIRSQTKAEKNAMITCAQNHSFDLFL